MHQSKSLILVSPSSRRWCKSPKLLTTFLVPFGCIPWASEKESTRVSFLTPHVLTVIDDEGHHIYHIDPKYRFKHAEACQKFQETLRERKHLGAFDTVKIASDNETLSRRQVLRFWRRDEGKCVVTLTFLASSIGDCCTHRELDLAKYQPEAVYVSARALLRRPTESETVELRSNSAQTSIRIRFESIEGWQPASCSQF